jgi:hypothetical protein
MTDTKHKIPMESLEYPPRFELGTLKTVQFPLSVGNAIRMFCTTIQGERPLLPNWGLPQIVHTPITKSEEVEAIILANLKNYFKGDFKVTCTEQSLGKKVCNINYTVEDSSGYITVELS